MKIRTLLLSAILFLAYSCEETAVSEIAPAINNDITSLNSINELVVFQYDFQNEATGERHGFIIDRNGGLKSYAIENAAQGSKLPTGRSWTEQQVFSLLNLSQTVTTIDEAEILKYYNLSRKVYSFSLTPRAEDASLDAFAAFNFFKFTEEHQQQAGCGSGSNSHSGRETTAEYQLNVLNMEGAYSQENTNEDAVAIAAWLKGLQAEAGL